MYTKGKRCKKGVSNMTRKRQEVRLHQDWLKKMGQIIGYSRSTFSKCLKRIDQRETIENKPGTARPRSTSMHGDRTLRRFVKQDRRRSLRDLVNEFNQSVQVPIWKRSIQRRLSKNGVHKRIVVKTLTISLKNRQKIFMCDVAEINYTGQYKNNVNIFCWNTGGVREKLTCVCVAKFRGKVEYTMLRNLAAPVCLYVLGCICN